MARHAKAKPKSKGQKSTAGITDKAQSARFIEAARSLGIDDGRQSLDDVVRKLLRPKVPKR